MPLGTGSFHQFVTHSDPLTGHEISYSSSMRVYMHSTPQKLSFGVIHMHVDPEITILSDFLRHQDYHIRCSKLGLWNIYIMSYK